MKNIEGKFEAHYNKVKALECSGPKEWLRRSYIAGYLESFAPEEASCDIHAKGYIKELQKALDDTKAKINEFNRNLAKDLQYINRNLNEIRRRLDNGLV